MKSVVIVSWVLQTSALVSKMAQEQIQEQDANPLAGMFPNAPTYSPEELAKKQQDQQEREERARQEKEMQDAIIESTKQRYHSTIGARDGNPNAAAQAVEQAQGEWDKNNPFSNAGQMMPGAAETEFKIPEGFKPGLAIPPGTDLSDGYTGGPSQPAEPEMSANGIPAVNFPESPMESPPQAAQVSPFGGNFGNDALLPPSQEEMANWQEQDKTRGHGEEGSKLTKPMAAPDRIFR